MFSLICISWAILKFVVKIHISVYITYALLAILLGVIAIFAYRNGVIIGYLKNDMYELSLGTANTSSAGGRELSGNLTAMAGSILAFYIAYCDELNQFFFGASWSWSLVIYTVICSIVSNIVFHLFSALGAKKGARLIEPLNTMFEENILPLL